MLDELKSTGKHKVSKTGWWVLASAVGWAIGWTTITGSKVGSTVHD